ncbi:hypothetical protein [Mucilaginibacter terrae]|uniref:Uncharacterized protein n=1 Tax=Mucilaginibacter terrae TaxID=1955052 RepID=A0ABU3GPB3_9SPHI|nr:hypothetical protein [Mucilaginibacter terrae]MDT3401607.1 hypothetical protein [Mucilaginibacter terrae]
MHNSTYQTQLRAELEANYLCTYINQYKQHYANMAYINLHTDIGSNSYNVEHDMLLPLINDAFRFGVFKVDAPAIMFDLQLNSNSLTFSVHYRTSNQIHDERTRVVYMRIKQKLESLYPGTHLLYRDYCLNTYLVILQIHFN